MKKLKSAGNSYKDKNLKLRRIHIRINIFIHMGQRCNKCNKISAFPDKSEVKQHWTLQNLFIHKN